MAIEHGTPEDDYRIGRAAKNVAMAHRSLEEWKASILWLEVAVPLLVAREEESSDRVLEAKIWLVDSMLRENYGLNAALELSEEVVKVMLASENGKNPMSQVNAVLLRGDVLAAMGRFDEAKVVVDGAWEVTENPRGDDPRIEARELLLAGDASVNPSEELAEALAIARARWASRKSN